MPIPYRQVFGFSGATLEGHDTDNNSFNDKEDWTNKHYGIPKVGNYRQGAFEWWRWRGVCKPSHKDFKLESGMDKCIDWGIYFVLAQEDAVGTKTKCSVWVSVSMAEIDWNYKKITGQTYDGENDWPSYPVPTSMNHARVYTDGLIFDTHKTKAFAAWAASHSISDENAGIAWQDGFFRNGIGVWFGNYKENGSQQSLDIGDSIKYAMTPQRVMIRYHNPVVNGFSRYSFKAAGGDTLILTGLGFNCPESEIESTEFNPNNTHPAGGWESLVDSIIFESLQGHSPVQIFRPADFSVDSNTQITIPSMPALGHGAWKAKLRKGNVYIPDPFDVEAYAGKFRCDDDGRVSKNSRGPDIILVNSDGLLDGKIVIKDKDGYGDPRNKRASAVMGSWAWRKKDKTEILDHIAMDDIRCNDIFYDGRIISISQPTRTIDENTRLFNISEVDIEVANDDRKYSDMSREYHLKNQGFELALGFENEPEAWKASILQGIVESYHREGKSFFVKIKDPNQKYFKVTIPKKIITAEDNPNAPDTSIGKPWPIVLGHASYTGSEAPGMVEAPCIDTVNHKHAAAYGSLKEIENVYAGGEALDGAKWSVLYDEEGNTVLKFTESMEGKKITFNAKGCMYEPWNSVNGFVQNPAYVKLFFLAFIMGVPESLVNIEACEKLADYCEDEGIDEAGYLVIQNETNAEEILTELLFDLGAYGWSDKDGRFKSEREDSTLFSKPSMIFGQLDALGYVRREYGFDRIVNYTKTSWGYVPAASLFQGTFTKSRQASIDDFSDDDEVKFEESFEIKWINSESWAKKRAKEELLKLGYGKSQFFFEVPIGWVAVLDLMGNIKLQDLYGIDVASIGEAGRLSKISRLSYDTENDKIGIITDDLHWLLGLYWIFGTYDEIPEDWEDATWEQRFYAYFHEYLDGVNDVFDDEEEAKILPDYAEVANLMED